jgi:ADP-heptose:LPS heptosyltransferase
LRQALGDRDVRLTVLVVRLGALGDVLRTIPTVRLVRRGLPHAAIWWVVDDRWQAVLAGHPDLTGTIVLPRREWQRCLRAPALWPDLLRSVGRFRRRLRAAKPDLVLDFHGNLRSGLVGRMSSAPVRLGYDGHQQKEANRWLTTHRVPPGSRRTPRIERNLELLRVLGLPDRPLPLGDLPLSRAGSEKADVVLAQVGARSDRFAVVNPGASLAQAYKRPPAELLAVAAGRLRESRVTPLVVWGPGEEQEAHRVVELAAGAAVLAPPTDLATLASLLERSRLFVGGDSGPLHLACLVGCPVLALYGGTDTGSKRIDRQGGGFTGVTKVQLLRAVDELLSESC